MSSAKRTVWTAMVAIEPTASSTHTMLLDPGVFHTKKEAEKYTIDVLVEWTSGQHPDQTILLGYVSQNGWGALCLFCEEVTECTPWCRIDSHEI